MKKLYVLLLCCAPMMYTGCSKKDGGGGGINLFTIEDDKQLGLQVKAEIESKPGEFPVLDPVAYASAYNYINGIRNEILNSGRVTYKNEFLWEVYIIKQDDVQNAFCTPGGYIYVYTGLIKYLDSKSALAGVMGHEIAHADKRHSTEQLTKIYGIQTLLDIVLGNDQGLLSQVATQLVGLKFSRDDEREADMASVTYLCPTKFEADGAADFFRKIVEGGATAPPEFLSTHPSPDDRVENIEAEAEQQGCTATISEAEEFGSYQEFKASL